MSIGHLDCNATSGPHVSPIFFACPLESSGGARHRYAAPREQSRNQEDDAVPDSTFLAQLELRTQQVKITLANLEAERARIEQLIGQLQPIIPHYDALLAAERALVEANVPLDAPAAAAHAEEPHESEPAGAYSWHG
jgi:hypothetical protein